MTASNDAFPDQLSARIDSKIPRITALIGLVGLTSLFLPFAEDESPLTVLGDRSLFVSVWRITLPFFLALPVSAYSFRLAIAGAMTRCESALAFAVSMSVACLTLSLCFDLRGLTGFRDWLSIAVIPVLLLAGLFIMVKNWRGGVIHGMNALVSLQISYLINCVVCLIAFFGEWQPGAYCALLTTFVYGYQIIGVSRTAANSGYHRGAGE